LDVKLERSAQLSKLRVNLVDYIVVSPDRELVLDIKGTLNDKISGYMDKQKLEYFFKGIGNVSFGQSLAKNNLKKPIKIYYRKTDIEKTSFQAACIHLSHTPILLNSPIRQKDIAE